MRPSSLHISQLPRSQWPWSSSRWCDPGATREGINEELAHAALSSASASRLLETARGVVVNGERIIHKNTHAAGMFVVVTGAVRVVDAEGSLSVLVAELGPGEIFGEFDVVTGQGTTCHVDAVDDVTLLTLDPGAVRSVLADDAPARDWIQRHALERRRQIEQLDTGDVVLLDE